MISQGCCAEGSRFFGGGASRQGHAGEFSEVSGVIVHWDYIVTIMVTGAIGDCRWFTLRYPSPSLP